MQGWGQGGSGTAQRGAPAPGSSTSCPHLGAGKALSAFALLQNETHVREELHTIPRFPAEGGRAEGQQVLPEAQGSRHVPAPPTQGQPPAPTT